MEFFRAVLSPLTKSAIWSTLLVDDVDLGAVAHLAALGTVGVAAHVSRTAGGEVGINLEVLAPQDVDGGVDQLVEVVGQDFGGHTHAHTVHALREQQRELDGQRDGLLVAAVVRDLPVGGLVVEDHLQGELGEARLDVTGGSRRVAGQDVTPVTLRVDDVVLLPHRHEGGVDGLVAVRVVFHRVTHDVGHLVVTPVLQFVHRVENTPLHRLEAVIDIREGAVEDNIGGVVQEPLPVHRLHKNDFMKIRGLLLFGKLDLFQFIVGIVCHRL